MSTLNAGSSETQVLAPGTVLTATASASGVGVARRFITGTRNSAENKPIAAGGSVTFGPYLEAVEIGVECTAGTVAWGTGLPVDSYAATQALVSGAGQKLSVACGMLAQSLPFGAVLEPDAAGANQKTYFSAPNQNYYEPDRFSPGAAGGYFVPALQALGAEGIKVFFTNTALGGVSLIFDVCGTIDISNGFGGTGWRQNRAYRGRRTTLGNGDPGTKGEFILESGRVWECTTGCTHLAFIDSDTPVTVEATAWRRQLTYIAKNTDRTSSNSGAKPTFSAAAAVNDTVVDNGAGALGGGIVWTCVAIAAPAADASGVRVSRNADLYWDPYGMALRARNAIVGQPVPAFNRYMIVVGTIQADAGQSAILTRLAHQLITTYNAADSVKTIHTMCLFYPQKLQADYDAYETVLSNTGLAGAENYAGSVLTTNLTGSGYTFGIPGTTTRASSTVFYYMRSLYRHFGLNVLSMLQTPQPNPHVTENGARLCASRWVAPLRSIFRNEAQVG